MNIILQNIRRNRMIALRQLIDEILDDQPSLDVQLTLVEIRFYVQKLNAEIADLAVGELSENLAAFHKMRRGLHPSVSPLDTDVPRKRRKLIGWSSDEAVSA